MADERDAFGRSGAEDSGLGWPTSSTSDPQPQPPPQHRAAPDSPAPDPRRRSIGPLVLTGSFLAAGAIIASLLVGSDSDVSSSPSSTGTKATSPAKPAPEDTTVPEQVRSRSFFSANGLRSGLRVLAREQPGRITSFSMRRDRINLQVLRRGRNHILQLSQGAEVPDESTSVPVTADPGSFGYGAVDPRAPARLMRAANRRVRESPADVDYFVLSRFSEQLVWGVYYKNGKIAQGDARGRFIRRIS
jgi:hypothetical protein